MSSGFSYDKWAHVGDSDDETEAKYKEFARKENSLATNYVRGLFNQSHIMSAMRTALNEIEDYDMDKETEQLLGFICVQQHEDRSANNLPVAAAIIELFDLKKVPRLEVLLAVADYLQPKARVDKELQPLFDTIVGAINTIAGANHAGSVRRLFEQLASEPDGEVSTRYVSRGYGQGRLERYQRKKAEDAAAYEKTWTGRVDRYLEGYGEAEWFLKQMPKPARWACEEIYDKVGAVYGFFAIRPKLLGAFVMVGIFALLAHDGHSNTLVNHADLHEEL